ncbi:MAG: FAD-dependent oxidoreductase [Pirellulales bacterium]
MIGAKISSGLLPDASYWDTSEPYYYLRVDHRGRNDYVIFGGEDHKTGQANDTEKCFANLERALRKLIPEAKPDRRWSGQVIETNDGLPYIGPSAPHQYVATGFSGNGMTFGTVAGMMVRDAIAGRNNPWSKLFSVDRKKLRGGLWDYLVENVDYPYYFVKDRLSRAEGSSTRSVKRGGGKLLDIGGERVACARDEQGKLHERSAYCTHLGCLVRWNSAEKTWDCPCHGSRFKPTGEVIAGPAETPLEAVKPRSTSLVAPPPRDRASAGRKPR